MSAIPTTMTALVKEQAVESYEMKTVRVPVPTGDDLLVKVDKVAICGSDINLYKWNKVAETIASLPFTPGHECVGTVVAVGDEVSQIGVGDRVCCENHFFCGECFQCKHDQRHICANMNQFGHGKGTPYGGCSQYTIIPERYAYKLKTDISGTEACLLEPMGVAHQAVEAADVRGESVLVFGCGPVGLFTIAIAKVLGAAQVIAVDVLDSKLAIAASLGADTTLNSATLGSHDSLLARVLTETAQAGVGRLLEVSGVPSVVNSSFTFLRKGGLMVFVGLPKAPIHIEDPLPNFVFKSLTIKTVHGRKIFSTWEESEKLLHEKKICIDKIVSHEFGLSEFEKAMETLMSGEGCKIVMDAQH